MGIEREKTMRILITGANGQLGYDVLKRLELEGVECLGTNRKTLDITNEEQVNIVISDFNPDVVIHCAAYTSVDRAEKEQVLCYSVNVLGTKYVAEACKKINAKMVYISTDYVFDGLGDKPFEITSIPNPINYYGQTKYQGELEVQKILDNYFIVRISWVFGNYGSNFVKTMLSLGKNKQVSVVSDQIGAPTSTYELANFLFDMIKTNRYGIYHATNEGYCSWYEFACEIFKQAGMDVKVIPICTEDYPTRAKRPKNSRLDTTKHNDLKIKHFNSWQVALSKMINIETR